MKSQIEIVDITLISGHEKYLYKCLAPISFRPYAKRREYLERAVTGGFHKKILFLMEKPLAK